MSFKLTGKERGLLAVAAFFIGFGMQYWVEPEKLWGAWMWGGAVVAGALIAPVLIEATLRELAKLRRDPRRWFRDIIE
ncbi:hypothetical protein [Aeromicrobium piscarium]|uniref:Uncharacterized protein n=1 Tax=Aeromicrobium piscarium TaxID=2590901 RepID=A0A554SPA2_9ACTN|nr:hypothetical protein [Aeromicrobium piscarium]TSD68148.1 hypothetical protein FNM00_00695 [Aeromicrobium piscarium]